MQHLLDAFVTGTMGKRNCLMPEVAKIRDEDAGAV
jgi:hypothetical protein